MIITNKLNLPSAFVSMAREEEYEVNEGEYHVTQLLKGIRETVLECRHKHEIEVDVSDMIWLLFGTSAHYVLERQKEGDKQLKETRLKIDIAERTISGKPDLYDDEYGVIVDYKTCSVWKIVYGDMEDWRRQLLIYAFMLKEMGFAVNKGEIVALLKDHSKRDAKYKPDYPKLPVSVIRFKFSDDDFEECREWLNNRIEELKAAESLDDAELPICTEKERYNKGDMYAIMKKGNKKALKLCDSELEAETMLKLKGGDFIEKRPGEDTKCLDYCSVKEYCSYYKSLKGVER